MPGQRIRLLLIAVVAAGLCNYQLLTGRSRKQVPLNPRVIESTADNAASGGAAPTTATQTGYNRFPQQREQETTIRPRTGAAPQFAQPQSKSVDALNKDAVIQLAQSAIDKTARRYLDVDSFTPWQIMHGVLALRGDYKLRQKGQVVNAIEFISSGPKYRGDYWWEKTSAGGRGHPYSVPYHFEGHINQFPALLCMSALPLDHQLTAKGGAITVGDLVRNAQRTVNTNEELTWTLWLLTQYIEQDATWTNQQGQRWSMAELVRLQVADGVNDAPCGGTHQLFALAFARNAYLKQHGQLRGVWVNAEYKLRNHIETARQLQNSDGSFSTNYFKGRGYTADFKDRIRTSGHMLEWLMMALPASRLEEPWVHRAIQSVANDLIRNASAPAECGPMYHALHALVLYRERVAPPSKSPPQEQVAKTAPATPPAVAATPKTPTLPGITPPAPAPANPSQPPATIVDSRPKIEANKPAQPGVVVLSPSAPATISKEPLVVVKPPSAEGAPPAILMPADAKPLAAANAEPKPEAAAPATESPAARPPLVLKSVVSESKPEPVVAEPAVAATPPAPMPETSPMPETPAVAMPADKPADAAAAAESKPMTTLPSTSLVAMPPDLPQHSETAAYPPDLPAAAGLANYPADLPAEMPKVATVTAPATASDVEAKVDAPILPELATDGGAKDSPVTGLTIEPDVATADQQKPTGKPEVETPPAAPVRVSEAPAADTTVTK